MDFWLKEKKTHIWKLSLIKYKITNKAIFGQNIKRNCKRAIIVAAKDSDSDC